MILKNQDGKASFKLLRLPFVEMRAAYPKNYAFAGVELGVFKGINAEKILEEINIRKLWLVDCWGHFEHEPQTRERHGVDSDPLFWDKVFAEVNQKFSKYDNVEIIKAWSEDAASKVPDGLDFVYVDADHTYGATKKDIELWFPKLSVGGWLMGDDYMWDGTHQAVNEFAAEHNYILHAGSKMTQWWIIKDHELSEEVVR